MIYLMNGHSSYYENSLNFVIKGQNCFCLPLTWGIFFHPFSFNQFFYLLKTFCKLQGWALHIFTHAATYNSWWRWLESLYLKWPTTETVDAETLFSKIWFLFVLSIYLLFLILWIIKYFYYGNLSRLQAYFFLPFPWWPFEGLTYHIASSVATTPLY